MSLLQYHGEGKSLFKIYIVNVLLTLVTLGFYYPWAKAKIMAYHYSETEMEGSRFSFLGTGKEMFKGFIKALLIFGTWYAVLLIMATQAEKGQNAETLFIFIMIWELILFAILPIAIVGSLRYRFSRTTWRGVHMSYIGNVKTLYKVFIVGFLLTIVTFGIYAPWFAVNLRKEIVKNVRLGDLELSFSGTGLKLLGIFVVGYLLTIVTFGIYIFQFQANILNYHFNNLNLHQKENKANLEGKITGWGLFKLMFKNGLQIIFTLGLGAPYAIVRTLKYYTSSVNYNGNINFDEIKQAEISEADATGDSFLDTIEFEIF